MSRRLAIACAALLWTVPCFGQPIALQEFDATVERVRELVEDHRFGAVIELLEPLLPHTANRETRYVITAELGRASFHLGFYDRAYAYLREAVSIHPDRLETALYLQAASYIVGDRSQALAILEEVLRSGARDLYLAVTLPGERSFLADPAVWDLLDRHARPLAVDIAERSIAGVHIGQSRSDVAEALGAPSRAASGPLLTARAGPHPIWRCVFTADDRLEGITLHYENMIRYTPFRLRLAGGDWRITPAGAISAFGAPVSSSTDETDDIMMRWQFGGVDLSLTFGIPAPPRPPAIPDGVALLRVLELTAAADRGLDESGSIGQ